MEISVNQKYLRTSVRKLVGINRIITGMNAKEAMEKLNFTSGKAGRIFVKLLKSALANAKNNNKLDPNSLVIKKINVLKGPAFKRWQPVSRGMAHPIRKRTTHVRIVLTEPAKKEVISTKKHELEKEKVIKKQEQEKLKQEEGKNKKPKSPKSG